MKQSILFLMLGLWGGLTMAQTVAPANVYPSNLEENMYFSGYDAQNRKITGLYFMVLSDGDNSQHITPAFSVKLYLMPEGKTAKEDITVIETIPLEGIYHMGSHEFKNRTLDLSKVEGLKTGNYRLGIWVNADEDFKEDGSDNATLFKGTIAFKEGAASPSKPSQENKEAQEDNSGQ